MSHNGCIMDRDHQVYQNSIVNLLTLWRDIVYNIIIAKIGHIVHIVQNGWVFA